MTILIIGSGGQVGAEVVEACRQRNLTFTALARAELDVTNSDAVHAAIATLKPKVIINTAAYTAVDKAEEEEALALQVNGTAVAAIATAATTVGAWVLHLSTDYVFDGSKTSPYVESDSTCPLSAYGRSKLAGEEALMKSAAQFRILRVSWVFGKHGSNFVKSMIKLGKSRDQLSIVDDQVGAPMPAAAIAASLLDWAEDLLTRPENRDSGIFHARSAPNVSWFEFAQHIFKRAAELDIMPAPGLAPIPTSSYPTPARRPANSCLATERLDSGQLAIYAWSDYLDEVIGST